MAGTLLRRLSPRHRAWKRLLRTLTLDPDGLPAPLEQPGTNDFLICGSPRTGTALATAALYQPSAVVTVMEPWDGLRLPPAALFASIRDEIASTGRLGRGRLDVGTLRERGEVRWCRDGELPHALTVDEHYRLGIKWPAFWRYLDLLPETRFVVCLRQPAEVVESYRRAGGRLAEGLDYDVAFNRTMNEALLAATDDAAVRRVLLYDYVHERVLPHLGRPRVYPLRYERWFTEPDQVRAELGQFLGVALTPGRLVIEGPPPPSDDTYELVRRHCTTAAALGYAGDP